MLILTFKMLLHSCCKFCKNILAIELSYYLMLNFLMQLSISINTSSKVMKPSQNWFFPPPEYQGIFCAFLSRHSINLRIIFQLLPRILGKQLMNSFKKKKEH